MKEPQPPLPTIGRREGKVHGARDIRKAAGHLGGTQANNGSAGAERKGEGKRNWDGKYGNDGCVDESNESDKENVYARNTKNILSFFRTGGPLYTSTLSLCTLPRVDPRPRAATLLPLLSSCPVLRVPSPRHHVRPKAPCFPVFSLLRQASATSPPLSESPDAFSLFSLGEPCLFCFLGRLSRPFSTPAPVHLPLSLSLSLFPASAPHGHVTTVRPAYLNWSSVTPLPMAAVELTPPVTIFCSSST